MRAVSVVDKGWQGGGEVGGDTVRDSQGEMAQAEVEPHQPAVHGVLLVGMAETHCEAPN